MSFGIILEMRYGTFERAEHAINIGGLFCQLHAHLTTLVARITLFYDLFPRDKYVDIASQVY